MRDPSDFSDRWLTPREREVLELTALGLTNRQIGEAMQIAEQTVKNHLGNAMRKLSLHDRTPAVVIAIGEGLIGCRSARPNRRLSQFVHPLTEVVLKY